MQTPSPAPDATAPSAEALDAVLNQLEAAGDAVGVVRLVDRWAHEGAPSRAARMAEARALIRLCLMDRAWARLRELAVEDPDDVDVVRLTAEMFLERGWQGRARRMVERLAVLAPSDPELPELQARLERPAAALGEGRADSTRESKLGQARQLLASGKVIRARSILEKLLRDDPRDPRVRELLWAVRGDTQTRDRSLTELVEELIAGMGRGGWEGVEHTELSLLADDPETAEASKVLGANHRAAAFPSLFRAGESELDDGLGEDDDVTMAAVMASREELAEPPTADVTDPEVFDLSGVEAGDTQIMQVISRPEPAGPAPEVAGLAPATRQPVDLRALQQRAGGDTDGVDDFDDLDEDDDLVEIRRRAPVTARPAPSPAPGPAAPMNVIERIPVPDPVPDVPGEDEDTPPVGPAPGARLPPPVARPRFDDEPAPGPEPRSLMPVVLGAAVLAAVVMLLAAFGVRGILAEQRQAAVEQAVLDSDAEALRRAQVELRSRVEDGGAGAAEAASWLVVVDSLLYAHWEGAPHLEAEARKLVDAGSIGEGLPLERARLHLLWTREDPDELLAAAKGDALDDPSVRLLVADAAVRLGRVSSAVTALQTEEALGRRGEILRAQVNGKVPRSGELAALHPLGVMARARSAEVDEAARLTELRQLRAGLTPADRRMLSRSWATEAHLHAAAGRREAARVAWQEARSADPNDPLALEGGAASVSADQNWELAQGRLERCLELRPGWAGCKRGLVQVLLTAGKVDRARTITEAWRDAGEDMGLLGAWVDLHARTRVGRARALAESATTLPARDAATTPALASYLVGFAQPDPARAAEALSQAARLLRSSDDRWDLLLAERAEQLAAERGAARGP
jgi:tetratricopeptide (TPR) repeat protein